MHKATDYNYKNVDAIKKIEEDHPEMVNEFWQIVHNQYDTFCAKQLNYGKGNVMLGGDCRREEDVAAALMGLAIRITDKANRLINLTVKNRKDAVGESVIDSFQDLSVYGIIAQIIANKKWL